MPIPGERRAKAISPKLDATGMMGPKKRHGKDDEPVATRVVSNRELMKAGGYK